MTSVSGSFRSADKQQENVIDFCVSRLYLKRFEAVLGDLSLCANEKKCEKYAKRIKSWICLDVACGGGPSGTRPTDCFEEGYFPKTVIGIQNSLCDLIKHPGPKIRQAMKRIYLHKYPDADEGAAVEGFAYLLALKKSATSCEEYIKDYVGPYGARWNRRWYVAMAGCRILARERKVQHEEKDFSTWFRVYNGISRCSDIVSVQMRQACSADGAALPCPNPKGD